MRLYECNAQHQLLARVSLGLLTPPVLIPYLRLFLGRKVVGNVKSRPNIIRRLSLDHTGDSRTGQIQKRLDIHIVGSQNEFKQQNLLQLDKVSIPLLDHVRHDLTLEGFLNLSHGLLQMMLAKLNDLVKDLRLDVGKRNLNRALVVVVVCV
jgi:hypothetical protein